MTRQQLSRLFQPFVQAGCDDYLTKPIDGARFLPLIARFVESERVSRNDRQS